MIECIINNLLRNGIFPFGMDIHLAVVNEPFLSYIKSGVKTIESRFTINKIVPYNQIKEGDLVCMKAAGRPIDSCFIVRNVNFYKNSPEAFNRIRREYSEQICASGNDFWDVREKKKYISLIGIEKVIVMKYAFDVPKKDMRSWVKFKMDSPKDIFLISGKIGSGKTFWANQIAQKFRCVHTSFSDYIKTVCMKNGKECTRENLQETGTNVVNFDLDNFIYYTICRKQNETGRIVIDGLRHMHVYKRIKELFPQSNIVLLYINCSEEQRIRNLQERGEDTTFSDYDITEQDVLSLQPEANAVLNYSENIEAELNKVKLLFSNASLFDY